MPGQNIGYIRVSTQDQNTARQLDGVALDHAFEDKASAKDVVRPQLVACLKYVRKGDTLHVHSIDRLARNLVDLQNLVDDLVKRGVSVRFHKEGLLFSGEALDNGQAGIQRLMFQIIGAVAEFERALLRERQREGIAVARAAGKYTGRKRTLSPVREEEVRARAAQGEHKSDLAREFGVSRQTIYQCLKRG